MQCCGGGGRPEAVPARATNFFPPLARKVLVSAACAWEICAKVRSGKLPGVEAFAQDFPGRVQKMGFRELAETWHTARAGLLPGSTKTPLTALIAQSLAENLPLISNEALFDFYGVQRIW